MTGDTTPTTALPDHPADGVIEPPTAGYSIEIRRGPVAVTAWPHGTGWRMTVHHYNVLTRWWDEQGRTSAYTVAEACLDTMAAQAERTADEMADLVVARLKATGVGSVLVVDGNADDTVRRLLAAGWRWTDAPPQSVGSKRMRILAAPPKPAEPDRPTGPCPACGEAEDLSWQNGDDDRASCGRCTTEFYGNEVSRFDQEGATPDA